MKNPPAFQFYPQDFISDINVQAMTLEERGAYITLLCHCWIEDGIPKDSRVVQGWLDNGSIVAKCFYEKGGVYRNKRLDLERQKQVNWREKSKLGGLHSADNKKNKKGGSRVVQPPFKPSVFPLPSSPSGEDPKKDLLSIVVPVILYLNEKTGKKFNPKSKNTASMIRARAKEGATLDEFKKVIDVKAAKWRGDPKMDDYLRPSTLFNPTNFENYLNEIIPDRKKPSIDNLPSQDVYRDAYLKRKAQEVNHEPI
jgi:uncharacterized phage protein (TIGR02220 family)